jgi:hypothetical protein
VKMQKKIREILESCLFLGGLEPEEIMIEGITEASEKIIELWQEKEEELTAQIRYEMGQIAEGRKFNALLDEPMPCGHPRRFIISSGEGTNYCGMCMALGRMKAQLAEMMGTLGGMIKHLRHALLDECDACAEGRDDEFKMASAEVNLVLGVIEKTLSAVPGEDDED